VIVESEILDETVAWLSEPEFDQFVRDFHWDVEDTVDAAVFLT